MKKTLGPRHPEVALILHNLANSLAAQNEVGQALPLMQRALDIENGLIDQVMGFTSEAQKLNFLAKRRADLDIFLTLIVTQASTNNQAKDSAYTVWLKRKGAALEAQRQFQQALVQTGDPQGKALFERLSKICKFMRQRSPLGRGIRSAQGYQARLAELKKEQADIEAALAKCSSNYARARKRGQPDAATVAGAFPGGSVLVDFAKINIFDFKAANIFQSWKPPHYIAFVLPSGSPDRLTLIDLGEAKPIEQVRSCTAPCHAKRAGNCEPSPVCPHTHDLVFKPPVKSYLEC